MGGQWGRELKNVDLSELLKLFKKTFIPARNIFHSRAQFFNIKQEDNETLDEYWESMVDIERKGEFNRITPEENITYKFAATIKDKKAHDKFIKRPLKLQMVLESIEQDNYNRENEEKKPNKKHLKLPSNSSSSEEQIDHTHPPRKRKTMDTGKKKHRTVIAIFASNQTGHWNIYALRGERIAITARKQDILPKCAKPKPSVGYKNNQQRTVTPSHGLK